MEIQKKDIHKDTNIIPMLDRGLSLIELMCQNKAPMGVSELAVEMNLPKATVYRLLYTLEKNGFVEKDKISEKYDLGMTFIKIGEHVKSTADINKIAKPYMEVLAEITGETIYLCKTYYNDALVLDTISGEASALYAMVTPTIPLYCSALGRILLAAFSEDELQEYLANNEFPKRTINTKTSKRDIEKEIKKVKEEGFAIEIEEYEYGMTCIAGPLCNPNGEIIASLSVSGPATRIDHKGRERIVEEVRRVCGQITDKLTI